MSAKATGWTCDMENPVTCLSCGVQDGINPKLCLEDAMAPAATNEGGS